ncbi:MAG: mannitol dehydrogenase [Oscillospiraceae bacterium]|nr:mannitol dehydrogenase [Oscillospiraceae bacterium]
MGKAVIYGAGNIGRGFIGQLFARSGYEICFIDVDETLILALNRRGEYPVRELLDEGWREESVTNVRAVNGRDIDAAAREIAQADVMATAVGVNALPLIAGPLAAGIARRYKENCGPLNILICENLLNASRYMRKLLSERPDAYTNAWFEENIGLVETSVGRMVPVQTEELRAGDPLRVCVEEYGELPADRAAFKGEIPQVKGLEPFSPFDFYVERKLYIHNMGHAAAAYLGFQRGYAYIWEAVGDPYIRETVRRAMLESGRALCGRYNADKSGVCLHIEDLLLRFGNRQLGDTVARVGRDLPRKLAGNDRLFGAAAMCEEQGIACPNILRGIAAALLFPDNDQELTLGQLRQMADIVINKS